MCLTPESHDQYCQLARNLDDEKLLELDAHYRQNSGTSVDWELHGIVMGEIHQRREFRRQQLERSLWLASRRGRFIEAIKRWLISRGLWSSADRGRRPLLSLIGRRLGVLWPSSRSTRRLAINTLPGRQTPLEQL
jgi:hypothetical protein